MIINKRAVSLLFAFLASVSADSVDRSLAGRGTINAKKAHSIANPIVVDGDISEWIKGDIFAKMYRQGNSNPTWSGYELMATAYKRLECDKQRLCILVLGETGVEIEGSTSEAWFKDYKSGLSGDRYLGDPGIVFIKSGKKNLGWEGCFQIPAVAMTNPLRDQIEIHVNYKSSTSKSWDTGSTGKSQHGFTTMNLCPIEPEKTPVTAPVSEPEAAPVSEPEAAPISDPEAPPVSEPGALDFDPANQGGQHGDEPTEDELTEDVSTEDDDDDFDESELEPLTIDLEPANQGGGYGDPHLKTWHGMVFDFHGECDLLLTKSEKFHNDLGFEIQIRTQIRRDWSFIKEAALRIGDQIFEVTKDMVYHSNRATHGFRRRGINHLGGHDGVLPQKLADFPISYVNYDTKRHKFVVDMGEKGTVTFKIYGDFLSVTVQRGTEDFTDAVGLMGDFVTGELKGRDGKVMTDTDAFGLEWQVRKSDNKLFTEVHGVQFPETCKMPPPEAIARRRLAESSVSYQAAAKACGGIDEESRDACIFDILATEDLGMAEFDL